MHRDSVSVSRIQVMLAGATDEHAPLAALLLGLGPGQVGVGVHLGGPNDLVQPVRRDRVHDRRHPLVDVAGRLGGQLQAGGGEQPRLPRRRLAAADLGPGEREPVPQRQRLPEVIRGHTGRDTDHQPELGRRELRDLRAAVAAQHHATFAAVEAAPTRAGRAGVGVVAVGEDLGVLDQPGRAPVLLGAVLGGRLQQFWRRQRGQVSFEHVFDSIRRVIACQISPYPQGETRLF